MVDQDCIVVTGVGAITALGPDVESLWQGLMAGRRQFDRVRGFDVTGCRVTIAAEAPDPEPLQTHRDADTDRSWRTAELATHACQQALIASGLPDHSRSRTGLVLGTAGSGDEALEAHLEHSRQSGGGPRIRRLLCSYPKRTTTDRVGWALGLAGPRATVNTACSSGAVAIMHAMDLLTSRICGAVAVGGADQLTRYTLTGFASLRALDPEPCRPFDRARRGMSLGEGAGFLVLERLSAARRRGARIRAGIVGAGHTCDAGHLTAPDPEGRGAARAMVSAMEAADICPEQVGFVNAHGTGTPHNDAAEVRALRTALGGEASRCPVHSVKACIGHCMGAAGAIEAVVSVMTLVHGRIPHTPGLERPEAPDLCYVQNESKAVELRYGLTNSFGFGGNNATLVIAHPAVCE
jgi:3-oxoacyl-[acyl-carrier-protein] synthase II